MIQNILCNFTPQIKASNHAYYVLHITDVAHSLAYQMWYNFQSVQQLHIGMQLPKCAWHQLYIGKINVVASYTISNGPELSIL